MPAGLEQALADSCSSNQAIWVEQPWVRSTQAQTRISQQS